MSGAFEKPAAPHWGLPRGYEIDEWGDKVVDDDEEEAKSKRMAEALDRIVEAERAREK